MIYRWKPYFSFLLLVLQLGHLSLDSVAAVLAGNHSLEAVEVTHVGTSRLGGGGLGGGRSGPLSSQIEFGGSLGDLRGAGTTLNGDNELSKSQALKVDNLAGDSMEGTINDHTVGIDDLDNNGDLTLLLALVELSNAANLDKTSEERRLMLFNFHRVS